MKQKKNHVTVNLEEGDVLFGKDLSEMGFKKCEDEAALAKIADLLDTTEVMEDASGELHLFHRRGNDYFAYMRKFEQDSNVKSI